jgi:hypothetical protein
VTAEDMFPTKTVDVGGCEGGVEDAAAAVALPDLSLELAPLREVGDVLFGFQGAAETDKT